MKRESFSRWDSEIFPQFNNSDYLDYKWVSTGFSTELCSYGFKIDGKWIKKSEIATKLLEAFEEAAIEKNIVIEEGQGTMYYGKCHMDYERAKNDLQDYIEYLQENFQRLL